jgi:hypothetical protein
MVSVSVAFASFVLDARWTEFFFLSEVYIFNRQGGIVKEGEGVEYGVIFEIR